MRRWQAFETLCACLCEGLLQAAPHPSRRGTSWELLIEASSYHGVTPALAWCVKDRTDVPPPIREQLEAVFSLNGERNRRLSAALSRIVATLNGAGIEPMLLKGGARLVDGLYPAPALRFMGDLDLLVPADRAADAFAALQDKGFRPAPSDAPHPSDHHHLPMLFEPGTGAGVELHTELAPPPFAAIIPAEWFWMKAKPLRRDALRAWLPEATRTAAHIVIHDQLGHAKYSARRLELRQLLDLAMLRARDDGTIDWAELDRRFGDHGVGQVLATYLAFDSALLGQTPPPLGHVARPGAVAGFRRAVDWPKLRGIADALRLPRAYLSARRRDPLGVVRLFNPRKWVLAIHQIKTQLRPVKW